jgi:ADP-ribosylglycohydrolase
VNEDIRATTFYKRTLGCLIGGLIGDAMGTPSEGMHYREIDAKLGWISDFDGDGTDDTIMKTLLAEALIGSVGYAGADEWAQVWLDRWHEIFGQKVGKFFPSVLHTAAKLKNHIAPRMAGLGNMPSSSSAMCIAPVGIINACNPEAAARQAHDLAGLIHVYDVAFCRDGAAAIAAAVAAAFIPEATTSTILASALDVLAPLSGTQMRKCIGAVLQVAEDSSGFEEFRETVYQGRDTYFREIMCDSRETVPISLGLLALSNGDVEKAVIYGANFGRDADTIASMCGGIAGAFAGVEGIAPEWVEKVNRVATTDQEDLAERLCRASLSKLKSEREKQETLLQISAWNSIPDHFFNRTPHDLQ